MPECYEVRRMADYLIEHDILKTNIIDFKFLNKGERILKKWDEKQFINTIKQQKIHELVTKAKYTFLQLSNGVIEWHYRFTAIPHIDNIPYENRIQSIYSLPIIPTKKSIRFECKLDNGHTLYFTDTRCLASLIYYPKTRIQETKKYQSLAPDLYQKQCLIHLDHKKYPNQNIKQFLLNQHTQPSGIGNYLACEICAYAKLYPNTPLKNITPTQIKQLNKAIKSIHQKATSTSNYHWFKVFNKKNCDTCGSQINKTKFKKSEQTTHWCNFCQPPKENQSSTE